MIVCLSNCNTILFSSNKKFRILLQGLSQAKEVLTCKLGIQYETQRGCKNLKIAHKPLFFQQVFPALLCDQTYFHYRSRGLVRSFWKFRLLTEFDASSVCFTLMVFVKEPMKYETAVSQKIIFYFRKMKRNSWDLWNQKLAILILITFNFWMIEL